MKDNPLIIVLKLVIADPELRHLFIRRPGRVFKILGLGCPMDMVGKNGRFCPVMPELPEGEAAYDIEHEYWAEWLAGGLDQLKDFRRVVGDRDRFPSRSAFKSKRDWEQFVERIKVEIRDTLDRLHQTESGKT
ncbi:hypothetical protein [Vulcanococcus sp. Clear-D1]|uniref:hypothetical protein n=1 Tax=Vulcanococcus sp. Clear-D1 TaxID=2766970 RepID=UPI001982D020|nr:hypothetical protein [Vulcanococcus sp. Clear-D1]MBD1194580.1 hypothetical protein [Vulcanococcus sp. Clear-D1]